MSPFRSLLLWLKFNSATQLTLQTKKCISSYIFSYRLRRVVHVYNACSHVLMMTLDCVLSPVSKVFDILRNRVTYPYRCNIYRDPTLQTQLLYSHRTNLLTLFSQYNRVVDLYVTISKDALFYNSLRHPNRLPFGSRLFFDQEFLLRCQHLNRIDFNKLVLCTNEIILRLSDVCYRMKTCLTKLPVYRNDVEIFLLCVCKDPTVLQYATPAIRKNKKVMLQAVKHHPLSLRFAAYSLRNDRDVVFRAVSVHGRQNRGHSKCCR